MTNLSKSKLLAIFAVLMLLLNIGLMAFIFTRKPPPSHFNPGPKGQIAEMLQFDETQLKEYEVLIKEHRFEMKTRYDEVIAVKAILYKSIGDELNTQSDSLMNVIGDLHIEMEQISYAHFEAIKDICREDQLPLFEELKGELAGLFKLRLEVQSK